MPAQLIDGIALSQKLRAEIASRAAALTARGKQPGLAVILVGEDPASQVYVRNKRRDCDEVGINSQLHALPASTSQEELLTLIARLNRDDEVHGILVQLPLPAQIDTRAILEAISPNKDVDAFHPENVGLLVQGHPRFMPCTPAAVQQLLIRNNIPIAGKHVVVVGRSDIVGKPLSIMLAQRGPGGDATVTICHSRTPDLGAVTRMADILVVAIGRAKFIAGDMIRPGATVIDVGINRTEQGLVGDVDFESAREVAGYLTPVPGGVGPLTRVMLLVNTLSAARQLET
jgi:methylenetetrahydrofolate dehydrogenase (NADP+)/methenyltetrahydrofolate cyclohydrolase